jgi:hypothetical protein
MKKNLLILLLLLLLSSCKSSGIAADDHDTRYLYVIGMLRQHDAFIKTSEYYDIKGEIAKIDGGYRFYVTLDNPRVAMYDIEVLAIEENVDYSGMMAANIGVFDSNEYHMVPNQSNPDKGFAKGLVISATCLNPSAKLKIFVQWKNRDFSKTFSEYVEIEIRLIEG